MLKKGLIFSTFFLLLSSVFPLLSRYAQAYVPPSQIDKIRTIINPCILLGTCPTATPTPNPTATPTPTTAPAATATPFPTETPNPTVTSPSLTPITQTAETITQTPETTITATVTPILSPTNKPISQQLSQRETIMAAFVALLLLVISFLSWPKIKSWLHQKTQ